MIFCCCPNMDVLYGVLSVTSNFQGNLTHARFIGNPFVFDVSVARVSSVYFSFAISIPKLPFPNSDFTVGVNSLAIDSLDFSFHSNHLLLARPLFSANFYGPTFGSSADFSSAPLPDIDSIRSFLISNSKTLIKKVY